MVSEGVTPPIMGVVGWKNSGKTTLVEALLEHLTGRGLIVSTIKHAHHDFDIDRPGKDSYRHRAAGAREVLVASAQRWALIHEEPVDRDLELPALIARMGPCDLVLVEGFKHGKHRKIEVRRSGACGALLAETDDTICAVATDVRELAAGHRCLPLNDPAAIADFIVEKLGLKL